MKKYSSQQQLAHWAGFISTLILIASGFIFSTGVSLTLQKGIIFHSIIGILFVGITGYRFYLLRTQAQPVKLTTGSPLKDYLHTLNNRLLYIISPLLGFTGLAALIVLIVINNYGMHAVVSNFNGFENFIPPPIIVHSFLGYVLIGLFSVHLIGIGLHHLQFGNVAWKRMT
jgi:cytochrome b561